MSDYIKREDAIFIALQQPFYSLIAEIKQLDGIDIVRCGECKYWHKNRKEGDGMNVFDVCYDFQVDDFCSYGERKGE